MEMGVHDNHDRRLSGLPQIQNHPDSLVSRIYYLIPAGQAQYLALPNNFQIHHILPLLEVELILLEEFSTNKRYSVNETETVTRKFAFVYAYRNNLIKPPSPPPPPRGLFKTRPSREGIYSNVRKIHCKRT